MGSFSLTKAAKKDLRSIAKFTEERWGREQRKHYLKGMDDTFQLLADTPQLGTDCGYIAPHLLKFSYQTHVIYFDRNNTTKITVIRVLHKRMDVEQASFDT